MIKVSDKYPQKQGLVLPDFIHIKSQAAIGEIVGKSEQDADAGDTAERLRRTQRSSLQLVYRDSVCWREFILQ